MNILIINGPNLNMLGRREPGIYGTKSMEQVLYELQRQWPDVYITYRQSNHEGDIIDWIQETVNDNVNANENENANVNVNGIILNAGGYTHTSVAIRDAVNMCTVPVVEVHISNIYAREEFRRHSLLTDVCAHTIVGHGTDGYQEALAYILQHAECSTGATHSNQ